VKVIDHVARIAIILCLASGVLYEVCGLAVDILKDHPATPLSALERAIWSSHLVWLRYRVLVQIIAGALALPCLWLLPFSRGRSYLLARGGAIARRWLRALVLLVTCDATIWVAGWCGVRVPLSMRDTADLCVSIAAIALLASALLRPPATHSDAGMPSNNALQQTSGDGKLGAARC
jgi:hypothetical protein